MVCLRPLNGLSVPVKWALRNQVTGIDRPSYGHSLPVLRVSSTQSKSLNLGTSCEYSASHLCMILYDVFAMLYGDFVILRWRFLWYFLRIYDTSMILFVKKIRKVPFSHTIIYQIFTSIFHQKDDTLRLFSWKKLFSCAYKIDGKSKKYLIRYLIDTPKNYVTT